MSDRAPAGLQDDPRWRRLHDRSWTCPSCGSTHRGLFDIGYGKPDAWPGAAEPATNSAVATSTHFLSEDFCVLEDQHYFIRGRLEVPILGGDETFGLGVWSSLSKQNFMLYVETFDGSDQGRLGPWFGWFSNRVRGYPDTFGLKCQVRPRSGRERPAIEMEPGDHPISAEQRGGVTFDRLLDIYAAHGHDLRAALSDG